MYMKKTKIKLAKLQHILQCLQLLTKLDYLNVTGPASFNNVLLHSRSAYDIG
jgi:hypothetical protein